MRLIFAFLFLVLVLSVGFVSAQSPNGSIRGIVFDPDAKSIAGAEIIVVNDATGVKYLASTNNDGIYAVENLPPGPYRIQVSKVGFKGIIKPDLILNVQDSLSLNFTLPIGASSIVVTVEGGAPMIDTTDATVSTVVDRQFAENLPLNGRSFQALIQLVPGVVQTASTSSDGGQFSVNGQRSASNYWMVDGVSANIGVGVSIGGGAGNGLGGTLGGFSVMGGTNSLVSVDAMQEFRIQTSSYAPEFGRTPGAQISIVTRSGASQFHGAAFDYLRNDSFDANNWFADSVGLPRPRERQNDFGGTLGGPILKGRTFFFFSYEGLRLRLPATSLTTVPDLAARQAAVPALRPYLNAFPLPNGPEDGANPGAAQFNASYSSPASLDAYSLRIDHHIGSKFTFFGRYNYSPSQIVQRGNGSSLNTLSPIRNTTQTATAGSTWLLSGSVTNELRFNYSRVNAYSHYYLDDFGGAVPIAALPFPNPYTSQNSFFGFQINSLVGNAFYEGTNGRYIQRQINLVDNLAVQRGAHSLKFGVDYRRVSPIHETRLYQQYPIFLDVASAETGKIELAAINSGRNSTLLFQNLGFFAQDTWRATPRLTVTYGLRWDGNLPPSSVSGPSLAAVTGYNLQDLSQLALAPPGTSAFHWAKASFGPRIGAAYQLSQNQRRQTVVRGGFGVFYDLVDSEAGNLINGASYPFGAAHIIFGAGGGTFPFNQAEAAPPAITPTQVLAFDPNLKLPYTLQWNAAIEQALGEQQTLTTSYVGAVGRRLLQTAFVVQPDANFARAALVGNTAKSQYNALQLQFQRRLSRGLQGLASYTWSHSIDNGSAGSYGNFGNVAIPTLHANSNRGPSDFDVRHAFSAGATYDIPAVKAHAIGFLLHGWSVENLVIARSALPVDISDSSLSLIFASGYVTVARPDAVPNVPKYVYGGQYPGGKAFNSAAFVDPPIDQNSGNPVRQGTLGRNAMRGFGATQWDVAIHREFPIHESLKMQFRAEMFNVLNHPNFAPPVSDISQTDFGRATETLGQYLAGGNAGAGALNPLYQTGGPRSIQLALKMTF